LKPASELQATAASFSKKAEAELKNVSSNERSLKVRMGDELVAKKVNVKELVASWAKRGEEPISKTEFRQHVRKMLDKTNAKEVDALFNELDEDHGGSLDVPEIRAALKKLQNAAAKRAEELAEMRAKADHFQMRANFASKAAQLTGELERTKKELEVQKKGSNNTFGQRLGMKLVGKGIKVGDLLLKWNDSKSGAISKGEWRKHVAQLMVMKPTDPAALAGGEVDVLFDSLNNGKSLDEKAAKVALATLAEAGKEVGATTARLEKSVKTLLDSSKKAQNELQKLIDEDAAAAIEAERLAREAEEEKAAARRAKAEAKAAKEATG